MRLSIRKSKRFVRWAKQNNKNRIIKIKKRLLQDNPAEAFVL
jgi:hypothetical protein